MRTACWNCRGLGNDSKVRRLKEMNWKHLLNIICLSETKQQDDLIRDVRSQLDCLDYVSVPPSGLSGGLVIFLEISCTVASLVSISQFNRL